MKGVVAQRLAALGLELPPVPQPRGAFKPYSRSGSLVFLAGQICEWNGEVRYSGRIGEAHRASCRTEGCRALRAQPAGIAVPCARRKSGSRCLLPQARRLRACKARLSGRAQSHQRRVGSDGRVVRRKWPPRPHLGRCRQSSR